MPIVVGRTGVAWDDRFGAPRAGEPVKREGDGRSPAGAFPLDTAFGFDARPRVPWIRLPYVQLRTTTECVDDGRSVHYNTIVDRDGVSRVDWASSEKMRSIGQYEFGVHVAYNAPPTPSRGSCIFLHIWAGPESVTAGLHGDERRCAEGADRLARSAASADARAASGECAGRTPEGVVATVTRCDAGRAASGVARQVALSGTKSTQTGRATASVAPVGVSVPFCGSIAKESMASES